MVVLFIVGQGVVGPGGWWVGVVVDWDEARNVLVGVASGGGSSSSEWLLMTEFRKRCLVAGVWSWQ